MAGRPYVYPNADARSPQDLNDFCSREKILALYNQEHCTQRVRMSADVQAWFEAEGRQRKWVAFRFSSDGCMMTAHVLHNQDATAGEAADSKVVSLDREARRRSR